MKLDALKLWCCWPAAYTAVGFIGRNQIASYSYFRFPVLDTKFKRPGSWEYNESTRAASVTQNNRWSDMSVRRFFRGRWTQRPIDRVINFAGD